MKTNALPVLAAALLIGSVSACGSSTKTDTATTTAEATTTTSAAASTTKATSEAPQPATTAASAELESLIPAPANVQRTDGPNSIQDAGVHKHFVVPGSPAAAMEAYKSALEGAGWSLTAENAGAEGRGGAGGGAGGGTEPGSGTGGGTGGGAGYTGTNGAAYAVVNAGGAGGDTDVDVCVWPEKPANTECGR